MKNPATELSYLRLNKFQKFIRSFIYFFVSIPSHLWHLICSIGGLFKRFGLAVGGEFKDLFVTFKEGDAKTRVSYLVMGYGQLRRKQVLRGLLFLGFELVFLFYMFFNIPAVFAAIAAFVLYSMPEAFVGVAEFCDKVAQITVNTHPGVYWLKKLTFQNLVPTTTEKSTVPTIIGGVEFYEDVTVYGDNNLKILIYGVLAVIFCLCFIYTWRLNIKQNKLSQKLLAKGFKLRSGKQDVKSMLDDQFHKTVLALPVLGIILFTVVPIIIMILIAFTNYDYNHTPPTKLFEWVGLSNFNQLFNWTGGTTAFSATFGEILTWTLVWAFFATFTNYFLGMLVAMMINKKGIKLKKLWRTVLVMTIAIPQFISLLYVSKMFSDEGLINRFLINNGFIVKAIPFWTNPLMARVMVILVNIWVGIPYLMLITTGVLMNIPADLYESSRIDGANAWQQYCRITLPYMLFVTGPYLLTSFVSNINNFNVIYLLTGGAPYTLSNSAGRTDLLITWLYRLTVTNNDYKLAAVIGIMVFVVVAAISLIVYNVMPSIKNEEDFQ